MPYLDTPLQERLHKLRELSDDDCFVLNDSNPIPGLFLALNPALTSLKHTAPKLAAQIFRSLTYQGRVTAASDRKLSRLRSLTAFLKRQDGSAREKGKTATSAEAAGQAEMSVS